MRVRMPNALEFFYLATGEIVVLNNHLKIACNRKLKKKNELIFRSLEYI